MISNDTLQSFSAADRSLGDPQTVTFTLFSGPRPSWPEAIKPLTDAERRELFEIACGCDPAKK